MTILFWRGETMFVIINRNNGTQHIEGGASSAVVVDRGADGKWLELHRDGGDTVHAERLAGVKSWSVCSGELTPDAITAHKTKQPQQQQHAHHRLDDAGGFGGYF